MKVNEYSYPFWFVENELMVRRYDRDAHIIPFNNLFNWNVNPKEILKDNVDSNLFRYHVSDDICAKGVIDDQKDDTIFKILIAARVEPSINLRARINRFFTNKMYEVIKTSNQKDLTDEIAQFGLEMGFLKR